MDSSCFALLDDCDAGPNNRRSRLYTDYIETLYCSEVATLASVLAEMQARLQQGVHVVTLFDYEFGMVLQGLPSKKITQNLKNHPSGGAASVAVLCFGDCRFLDDVGVEAWLDRKVDEAGQGRQPIGRSVSGVVNLSPQVDNVAFAEAIDAIHAYIEAGDVYQINYTYRLHFDSYGSPAALYQRLRKRQPAPFGAFIRLPEGGTVLSLSPELFLRHEQGNLVARPMKGTAAASDDARQDAVISAALAADPKNRAENLMIVDLLRNDLGRIARTGSVSVPHLFDVTRYGAVLQMTSTVSATIDPSLTLTDVVSALFPCGSITGAPKRRAMELIDEFEPEARGIYTGAIGWFEAPKDPALSIGDFCLSVPIRTIVLGPLNEQGLRTGTMGVGAGIVHDSDAIEEYAECTLKAAFLTQLPAQFTLFETMRGNRETGVQYRHLHLARLQRSATTFGFSIDIPQLQEKLTTCCGSFAYGVVYRIRLTLQQDGRFDIASAPLNPLSTTVKLLISNSRTDADDFFLRHKSSVRERYDAAWQEAELKGAFDMVFCNTKGEVTEGARSNIFIRNNGDWITPPVSAGVLPGVMRSVLIADSRLRVHERSFSIEDLRNADEIMICNALRGAMSATLDESSADRFAISPEYSWW